MAKLPSERRAIIWDFKQRLLDIVDEAKATELDLWERFGETESTLGALEQLTEIAEQAKQRLVVLHTNVVRFYEPFVGRRYNDG